MQKQYEALDRPWLIVDVSVAMPLTYELMSAPLTQLSTPPSTPIIIAGPAITGRVVRVGFTFHITNIGKSPAQNVLVEPRLIFGMDEHAILAKEEELCTAPEKHERLTGHAYSGYMLFPNEPPTVASPYVLYGPMEEFNEINGRRAKFGAESSFYVSTLVVCITYRSGASVTYRHTCRSSPLIERGRMLGVDLSKAPIPVEALDVPHSLFFGRDLAN
jgi:hypothetical protein